MVITLLIVTPFMLLLTGLLVLYAVYMGLKWNYQINVERKQPESPLPDNPVSAVVHHIQDKAQEKTSINILQEWLNGAPKEGNDP